MKKKKLLKGFFNKKKPKAAYGPRKGGEMNTKWNYFDGLDSINEFISKNHELFKWVKSTRDVLDDRDPVDVIHGLTLLLKWAELKNKEIEKLARGGNPITVD